GDSLQKYLHNKKYGDGNKQPWWQLRKALWPRPLAGRCTMPRHQSCGQRRDKSHSGFSRLALARKPFAELSLPPLANFRFHLLAGEALRPWGPFQAKRDEIYPRGFPPFRQ